MARIKPEFDKRNVKIFGLSSDPVGNHAKWATDIGLAPSYPVIGDTDLKVAKAWGMLLAAVSGDASKRTAADNQTVRNAFVVGLDKKIKGCCGANDHSTHHGESDHLSLSFDDKVLDPVCGMAVDPATS